MAIKKILGIDPGSRHTGYAVLVREKNSYSTLACGVIHTEKIEDHTDRLQQIFSEVTKILKQYKPDLCAVETPVYGIDPLAMLKLGRAQAAALLAITNLGIPVSEYYPKAVKKSVTGNGNASKKQVACMLEKLVTLPDQKLTRDATDAIAVAWCHFTRLNGLSRDNPAKKLHQNNRKSGWKQFVEENPDRVNS